MVFLTRALSPWAPYFAAIVSYSPERHPTRWGGGTRPSAAGMVVCPHIILAQVIYQAASGGFHELDFLFEKLASSSYEEKGDSCFPLHAKWKINVQLSDECPGPFS
jgi:hypothetical protein